MEHFEPKHLQQLYLQHEEPLQQFLELLMHWNQKINLTGSKSRSEIEQNHLWPSAIVAQPGLIPLEASVCDLGSGGGFPGLVMAILRPDLHIMLTESINKKASFLRYVAQQLQLTHVTVHGNRIEELLETGEQFSWVTARFFASIDVILPLSDKLLLKDGHLLVFKPADEVTSALASYSWVEQKRLPLSSDRYLFHLVRSSDRADH